MYREILKKAIEGSAHGVHSIVQADISETGSPLKYLIREFDGLDNLTAMVSQSMLRGFQKLLAEDEFVVELSNQEVSDAAAHTVAQSAIDFLTGYSSSSELEKNEVVVEALKEMAKTSVGEEIFLALRTLTENFDEGSVQSFNPAEGPKGTKSSTYYGN